MPKAKSKPKPKAKPAPVIPEAVTQLLEACQIWKALGIAKRKFYGMVSAGEYPPADLKIGRLPRWRVATHNAWIERASK